MWLFTLVLCLDNPASAQEANALSLEDAIGIAQRRSPSAAIARASFESVAWEHRAFQAAYMPAFSFFGTAPGFDRNITELQRDDGTVAFVPQSKTSSYGSLSLDQRIPLTGGTVSLRSGLSRIDQFGDNRFYQWRSQPLIAELTQPLFQFNAMRWERRLAPLQFDAARRGYEEDLAQIAVDVSDRFFAAYIARQRVINARYNVAFNDTTYHISQGRFDLTRISENELLESELHLLNAQSALSEAEIEAERVLRALRLRLGLPYDADFALEPPAEMPLLVVDPTRAVALARQNRAVYLEHGVRSMQAEREVSVTRRRSGLAADLTARYGLNQSADVFSSAYKNPLNQQSFQLIFRVPLYQWGRREAELESALATRDETEARLALERAQIEEDVYFLALQVTQLQEQVALAAKADTIAVRRFDVARNLHAIGRIELRDLFLAQQAKDEVRERYLAALHHFWRSYYELRRSTMYDFVENRPVKFIGDG